MRPELGDQAPAVLDAAGLSHAHGVEAAIGIDAVRKIITVIFEQVGERQPGRRRMYSFTRAIAAARPRCCVSVSTRSLVMILWIDWSAVALGRVNL